VYPKIIANLNKKLKIKMIIMNNRHWYSLSINFYQRLIIFVTQNLKYLGCRKFIYLFIY